MPPMPVATTAASRSGSTSGLPASAHACRAATTAYCAEGSRRLASCLGSTSGEGVRVCAAKVTGMENSWTQSWVRGLTPERPARAASQEPWAESASGVTAPRPVTSTRVGDGVPDMGSSR